jgi:hypothetical protein
MPEKQIIGQKIKIEYFDQNSRFESCFPAQICEIVQQFSSVDGAKDWFLVKLEKPFAYEGRNHTHLLIRSRWHGLEVGGSEPTAIFILLILDESFLREPIDTKKFDYVAWGFVYPMGDS